MRDIKLSDKWDIDTTGGTINFVSSAEAMIQKIKQKYQTFLGEWILDETIGVPYYQKVFIKNYNQATINTIFKRVLVGIDGISNIDKFIATVDKRNLSISFEAKYNGVKIKFNEVLNG